MQKTTKRAISAFCILSRMTERYHGISQDAVAGVQKALATQILRDRGIAIPPDRAAHRYLNDWAFDAGTLPDLHAQIVRLETVAIALVKCQPESADGLVVINHRLGQVRAKYALAERMQRTKAAVAADLK